MKRFIFLFFIFSVLAAAESDLPIPQNTSLLKKTEEKESRSVRITYKYVSKLKEEDIISFYREKFNSLGVYELKNKLGIKADTYFFEKTSYFHTMRSIMLNFDYKEQGSIYYTIVDTQYTKFDILPFSNFYPPKSLDFMPIYSNCVQFVYNTYFSPMIGLAYLSDDEPDKIANFYTKNMPSFGWQLVSSEAKSGIYQIYDWLAIIDPFTKVIPQLQIERFHEIVPPLKIRGQTLNFKRGSQTCTITVYKFDDIVEKAKASIWDASSIERYGNTIICVYYFST
ncbi:MAG: hypothetical protein NC918_06025 [Candidatus Omnitrophica bacterium]|nr:hypothetical protein [Candidatus Omnitrophota bacterium]